MPEPVVGRTWELAALAGLLDEVERGRGQGALLLGDAGIGKSTTAAAFADTARDRGFTVVWGRCPETETMPYWPWRQAFRALGIATALPTDAATGRTAVFAEVADQLAATIEQVHPALGRHLRASVHTGRQCVYEPEDEVTWHCQSIPGA